jgi:beta-1,2-mannobiose phosphorylase / 1,2-beta-oligomannan phosphorylase
VAKPLNHQKKKRKKMSEFKMERLRTIMTPEPGNELEVEGVLNPAAIRGKDGNLYLFPRLVSKGNYSRIGIARVKFDEDGDPIDIERLGVALEPEADYEKHAGGGGCEDPRIVYAEELGHYVMNYVAFGPNGPRIAIARSNDLFNWERIGLARFAPYHDIKFEGVDNKDSSAFPQLVPNPDGEMQMGIIHRPIFPGTSPEDLQGRGMAWEADIHCESIWVSYCPYDGASHMPVKNANFTSHHRLAAPEAEWEKLKIGCGTPPVMTKLGWMILYHGVHEKPGDGDQKQRLNYSAGIMVMDKNNLCNILYRSPKPILSPESADEQVGLVANVVFPTGIDQRMDIAQPNRFDVYYGMADDRIGVARLDIPDNLPEVKTADI